MMISAGIVSFHHPDFLFFCRNKPLVLTWPTANFLHQRNLKMGAHFYPLEVLGGSCQASDSYCKHISCATARRNRYQQLSSNDEFYPKPFWLTVVSDIVWSLRSLAFFLIEQPSQLKYIEWPSIESTAKTATLTLVLVTLLMVSLATVDSCLFYILALLSRKTA